MLYIWNTSYATKPTRLSLTQTEETVKQAAVNAKSLTV